MFDLNSYIKRINCTKANLCRALDLDPTSSLSSSYIAGRCSPSFEICIKLLKHGMSIKEMFGEEIDEKIKNEYLANNTIAGVNPTPKEIVISGLKAILSELENVK